MAHRLVHYIAILRKVKFCFELFCLQNSLIVGMQPHVSGKVGSLVGWLVGWLVLGGPCSAFPMTVEFYLKASCRGRNLAGTEMQMRTHREFRH